jgi:hypothetical protein
MNMYDSMSECEFVRAGLRLSPEALKGVERLIYKGERERERDGLVLVGRHFLFLLLNSLRDLLITDGKCPIKRAQQNTPHSYPYLP